jgi:hypothetical protein
MCWWLIRHVSPGFVVEGSDPFPAPMTMPQDPRCGIPDASRSKDAKIQYYLLVTRGSDPFRGSASLPPSRRPGVPERAVLERRENPTVLAIYEGL